MSPTVIRFPYEVRASALFGTIHRPVAQVQVYSTAFQQWLAYMMVVDTGADYSVLPASVAFDLGVPLKMCEPHAAAGVGGPQRIFLYRTLRVRLGTWEGLVPVGFVEREDLPPLLGRYRCLDAFDLGLCNYVTTFSTRVRSTPQK